MADATPPAAAAATANYSTGSGDNSPNPPQSASDDFVQAAVSALTPTQLKEMISFWLLARAVCDVILYAIPVLTMFFGAFDFAPYPALSPYISSFVVFMGALGVGVKKLQAWCIRMLLNRRILAAANGVHPASAPDLFSSHPSSALSPAS